MPDTVKLSLGEAHDLALAVLAAGGVSERQAGAIARSVVAAERDECGSHGLFRLLGYVATARSSLADPKAEPVLAQQAPSVVRVDAAKGFAPLALETGLPHLVATARRQGMAAMAVTRCFHLGALWPEVERLAEEGLVALSCNPTHAYVAPAGGARSLLGTNPIAFGWPRQGQAPYVFDFATSVVARGEIDLKRRAGEPVPEGWALDASGESTTDADAALAGAMLTFGGHKGSALATMIELLAGPLIGDVTSAASSTLDAGTGAAPCHGVLIVAFDPVAFLGAQVKAQLAEAETLFAAIEDQGARLPSARRRAARVRSDAAGVDLSCPLYDDLKGMLR